MPRIPAGEELYVMFVFALIQDLRSAVIVLCQSGDDVMCIAVRVCC